MIPSKVKPFLTYLEEKDVDRLKKFAKKKKLTMSHIVREAVRARMADGDPYNAGFNDGIDASIRLVRENKMFEMRLPSGNSFADLVEMDLSQAKIREASNAS
jgi:hypothetical protein